MVATNDKEALKSVFLDAMERYQTGETRYGRFDPEHDQRDLLAELEAELLDGINYLGMFLIKIRFLKKHLKNSSKEINQ